MPGWYWSTWGVAALETWILAAVLYIAGVAIMRNRHALGFPVYELDTDIPNRPIDIVSPV